MRPRVAVRIAVACIVIAGCSFIKEAYRVDPVVVDSRPRVNRIGADIVSPFRQFFRFLAGEPPLDQIVLDEYYFPEEGPPPSTRTDATAPASREILDSRSTGTAAGRAADSTWMDRKRTAYALALDSPENRNRLAQRIVARSQQLCVAHMSGYVSQQAINEMFLGGAAIGLTAAGSVVGGLAAAQAISAAATAIAGTHVLVNDAVYYKQLTPVLIARASLQRDLLLVGISKKLQSASLPPGSAPTPCTIVLPVLLPDMSPDRVLKPAPNPSGTPVLESKGDIPTNYITSDATCVSWTQYPIDAVIADLKTYHDACSFYRALQIAARDIQAKSDEIAREINQIYEAAKKTPAPAQAGKGTPSATRTPSPSPTYTP